MQPTEATSPVAAPSASPYYGRPSTAFGSRHRRHAPRATAAAAAAAAAKHQLGRDVSCD